MQTVHRWEDTERAECVLCMAAGARVRLLPCCHVAYCEGCAVVELERQRGRSPGWSCPYCRRDVVQYEIGDFRGTFAPLLHR